MADRRDTSDFPALLQAISDGVCTAKQHARLEAILLDDADARETYRQYMAVHALLTWRMSPGGQGQAVAAATISADYAEPADSRLRRAWEACYDVISNYAVLGMLISGLFITTILLSLALWTVPDWRPSETEGRPQVVAQITRTRQASWDKNSDGNFKNVEMFAGERLLLRSGLAEVTFEDGAIVTLNGPVEFVIDTAGSGSLRRGKLVARVAPAAAGFSVQTPLATIVDLGTEFGVTVENDQSASTTVFAGSVLVQQHAADGTTVREHVVKAGKSVLLEPGRIVAAKPETSRIRYARNLQTSVDNEGNLVLLPTASATVDERGQAAWNGALKTGRDKMGPACASFLHFDLAASPLAADEVESATLKLWLTAAQQFGATHIQVAAEPWKRPAGQPRLDLPTTPGRYTAVATSRRDGDVHIPPATGQYHEVDVTAAVQSWLRDPAGNFGLVLQGMKSPTTGEYFTATYREYAAVSGSNPPLLVIEAHDPE